jgi:hypothetical protein
VCTAGTKASTVICQREKSSLHDEFTFLSKKKDVLFYPNTCTAKRNCRIYIGPAGDTGISALDRYIFSFTFKHLTFNTGGIEVKLLRNGSNELDLLEYNAHNSS